MSVFLAHPGRHRRYSVEVMTCSTYMRTHLRNTIPLAKCNANTHSARGDLE